MKKYQTTSKYRKYNKTRSLKQLRRRLRSRKYGTSGNPIRVQKRLSRKVLPPIYAPEDFRVLKNHNECFTFLRNLRSSAQISSIGYKKAVMLSLRFVRKIDYAAISILTSLSDDLKSRKILMKGDFPIDPDCNQFIQQSGFLDHMIDNNNKRFPKSKESDLILFETGCEVLSSQDNKKISKVIKKVVYHLTGVAKPFQQLKTIFLEICGNSIEHAYTSNKQWQLGVKFEKDKVIFTITDVGKGILETLHFKFKDQIANLSKVNATDEILYRAFERKYGSSTQEVNRNKGLPAIKERFEKKYISNLIVITNNVILRFDRKDKSVVINKGQARFKGTFYQWEVNKDNILNKSRENANH